MDSPSQQRIVVGVSGSLTSLVALQYAGVEARLTGRQVLAVLVWRLHKTDPPPGAVGSAPKGTRAGALRLLKDALNDVFGATDADIQIEGLAISGDSPGRTLVQITNGESDLLVIGGGHRSRFGRWRSPVVRHCVTHATCPVLTIPPPPLQLDLEALTRKKRLLRASANDPLRALRQTLPHRPAYTDSDP
ncbi:universal stress protein [Streptomyces sp. NPDC050625]|uniref:universal stress protein n=1 Tax=Streptomyces sp. NPDC050625 TaxID=3154629 RepID=UPI003448724B